MSDIIKIDWGDGVSALDRVTRGIVMMTDAALGRLLSLGYSREEDVFITPTEDGLPVYIYLRNQPVFEVNVVKSDGFDGPVVKVTGDWIFKPKARGWKRLLFWRQ